jgi:thiazole/oxazole-forming peptide maturase SagD family component
MSKRHDLRHLSDRILRTDVEFPVFAGRLIVHGRRGVCYLANREVEIEAPPEVLAVLARRCDGRTRTADIVESLASRWDSTEVSRLIGGLVEEGVICEGRELPRAWWALIQNPPWLSSALDAEKIAALPGEARQAVTTAVPSVAYQAVKSTPLSALLGRRCSTRTFSLDPLDRDALLSLLWAAYGCASTRTVPSAGAIYPLNVDYLHLRSGAGLGVGRYRASYLENGKVGLLAQSDDIQGAARCFLDPDLLSHAQGTVVISGDLARSAIKYQARSALYVPIEAGHAAQNVLLAAVERNLAAVEIGGFEEDRLASLLELPRNVVPLTTVVIGSQPTQQQLDLCAGSPEIEFRWADDVSGPYSLPFYAGAAQVSGTETDWSWGRAEDPGLAHTKAVAEAQERWGCSVPAELRTAPIGDVHDAVPPQDILAYTKAQYTRADFPFRPFDAAVSYLWKQGTDVLTGETRSVLADFVYFGAFLDRPRPYTSATSSGAAAHTSKAKALEGAVLELIERDAFMRTWLDRQVRPTIDPSTLPANTDRRVRALRQVGVEVQLKDHSLGLAPVVFAFAQSEEDGFTVATASAAFDREEALDSAMMELELLVALRLQNKAPRKIRPREVLEPEDHIDLYAQRRHFRRADCLAEGSETVSFSHVGERRPQTWSQLEQALADHGHKILWFDLTPHGASLQQGRTPLSIGRAIVTGLIPISFGWDHEPLATFQSDPGRTRPVSSQPLFPHPFG